MTDGNLTPMMRQYRDMRAEIPKDAVLLFRLGDFYEIFFDDAKVAAPLLEVVLTQRAGVPMCGVPYHALDNYLPRLLGAGVKVAIGEQIEDPKLATGGVVKRAISRVITPGTVMDASVLAPRQNNFLIAVCAGKAGRFGLAGLDVSTADFRITELDGSEELAAELDRLAARECVVPESVLAAWEADGEAAKISTGVLWTPLPDWNFDLDVAEEDLRRQCKVGSLDGFGCRGMNLAIRAAGAVLRYAGDNLRGGTEHIRRLATYHNDEHMILDPISRRNLELAETMRPGDAAGSLLKTIDQTATPMGARLLRDWLLRPLRRRDAINARLDAVGALVDDPMTLAELRETVAAIRDIERIISRLTVGSANARDLLALAASLEAVPGLKTLLGGFEAPMLRELRGRLHSLPEAAGEIRAAIADDPPVSLADGGVIRDGYSAELDEFRAASTEGKNWLANIQAKEQERTGIKSLKVRFNRVFGYFIEISKANLSLVPDDYLRKQTMTNAERFITPELKEVESKILGAEDKAKALEAELFQRLREKILEHTAAMQETAAALAAIDVLHSLAECARKRGYRRPVINDDTVINIKGGRHPVLDATMSGERFVPNDTLLDGDEHRMAIITGPNMAGKSTYIRQVALLVVLAQTGSFIPADSAAIGLVDRVFTRVGAADDLSRGQSTFMVEMVETANILNHATPRSLVVMDEIGRGTSTFDGLSIAWAVAEYLHDTPEVRPRALFATHYHELTELALTCRGVKNYNVAVREYADQIIFLRQIVPGGADKSYGIHVAKLAGLPDKVIERANEILENLENSAQGEAGQPTLAKHRKTKKRSPADSPPGAVPDQPSLFDWASGEYQSE